MSPGPVPEFSPPVKLFQSPLLNPASNLDQWGVTADGQRCLFLVPQGEEGAQDPITVVVNWQRALEN